MFNIGEMVLLGVTIWVAAALIPAALIGRWWAGLLVPVIALLVSAFFREPGLAFGLYLLGLFGGIPFALILLVLWRYREDVRRRHPALWGTALASAVAVIAPYLLSRH